MGRGGSRGQAALGGEIVLNTYVNRTTSATRFGGINRSRVGADVFLDCHGRINAAGQIIGVPAGGVMQASCSDCGRDWFIRDNYFYYGFAKICQLSPGDKCVVEFNGKYIIFPDKIRFTPSGLTHDKINCPDITQAVVYNNRIFGIAGNTLHACNLGDESRWDDYLNDDGSTKETGSFYVTTDAKLTAITVFLSHVMVFQKFVAFELYGGMPSTFSLTTALNMGVYGQAGVSVFDTNLYYAFNHRIWRYRGGAAVDLTGDLNMDFAGAMVAASADGLVIAGDSGTYLYQNGVLTQLNQKKPSVLRTINQVPCAVYQTDMEKLLAGDQAGLALRQQLPITAGVRLRLTITCAGHYTLYHNGVYIGAIASPRLTEHKLYFAPGGADSTLYIKGEGECCIAAIAYTSFMGDNATAIGG